MMDVQAEDVSSASRPEIHLPGDTPTPSLASRLLEVCPLNVRPGWELFPWKELEYLQYSSNSRYSAGSRIIVSDGTWRN